MASYVFGGKPSFLRRMTKRRRCAEEEEISEDEIAEMIVQDIGKHLLSAPDGLKMSGHGDRICAKDNHVYFNADIDDATAHKLNMTLQETIEHMRSVGMRYDIEPPTIKLHVTSFGGMIFSALNVVDTIIKSPVPIESYVEGHVASAGTFLTVVCKKRYMKKRSFMLIHQLSSGMWGKMSEIRDEAKNLEKITEVIRDIYLEYTSMSKATMDSLLEHDLWLKPDECLRKGLIDEVLE